MQVNNNLQPIFLDNHVLVLDKPAGLLTQDSGSGQKNLEDLAKAWLKQHFQRPGAVFLHAVHRIDRAACGLVLFARTSKALSRLNASLRAGQQQKVYRVRVEGKPALNEARLEDYLVHGRFRAKQAEAGQDKARLASLSYKLLANDSGQSLLEVHLETGRYHQIRAQLAAMGHPILGDRKYGSKHQWPGNGIALQHYQLGFLHPVRQEMVYVQSRMLI